jgi:hypothetical protein
MTGECSSRPAQIANLHAWGPSGKYPKSSTQEPVVIFTYFFPSGLAEQRVQPTINAHEHWLRGSGIGDCADRGNYGASGDPAVPI